MPSSAIVDLSRIDLGRVIADVHEIRKINPHRGDMEHLTAVVYVDRTEHLVVGYKDVGLNEFWVSGHMPGYPIMPGVLQLEAAAQLVCFYATCSGILKETLMGLAGVEKARFRAPVRPGDRLVLAGKGRRVDRRQTVFEMEGYVGDTRAFQCEIIGVPIPGWEQTVATLCQSNGHAHVGSSGG